MAETERNLTFHEDEYSGGALNVNLNPSTDNQNNQDDLNKEPKKDKKMLYFLIGVIVLISIFAIGYYLMNQSPQPIPNEPIQDGNVSGNISPSPIKPTGAPTVNTPVVIDFRSSPQSSTHPYGNTVNGAAVNSTGINYLPGTPKIVLDLNNPNNANYIMAQDSTGKFVNVSLQNAASVAGNTSGYSTFGIDINHNGKLDTNEIWNLDQRTFTSHLQYDSISNTLAKCVVDPTTIVVTTSSGINTTMDKVLQYEAHGETIKSTAFLSNASDATKYANEMNANGSSTVNPFQSLSDQNVNSQLNTQADSFKNQQFQTFQQQTLTWESNLMNQIKSGKPSEAYFQAQNTSLNTGEKDRINTENNTIQLKNTLNSSVCNYFKDKTAQNSFTSSVVSAEVLKREAATQLNLFQAQENSIRNQLDKSTIAIAAQDKANITQTLSDIDVQARAIVNGGTFDSNKIASLNATLQTQLDSYNSKAISLNLSPVYKEGINAVSGIGQINNYMQNAHIAETNANSILNTLSSTNASSVKILTDNTLTTEMSSIDPTGTMNWVSSIQREDLNSQMLGYAQYTTDSANYQTQVTNWVNQVNNLAPYTNNSDNLYSSDVILTIQNNTSPTVNLSSNNKPAYIN